MIQNEDFLSQETLKEFHSDPRLLYISKLDWRLNFTKGGVNYYDYEGIKKDGKLNQ